MWADLHHLLAYDRWANEQMRQALAGHAKAPRRAREILAHIASVHRLFLHRIGGGAVLPVWPDPDAIDVQAVLHDAYADWAALLSPAAGRQDDEPITYVNSKAERWTSRLGDIVTHVVMHGSYHRGQIALLLGGAGVTPPYTDFVHAARAGLIKH